MINKRDLLGKLYYGFFLGTFIVSLLSSLPSVGTLGQYQTTNYMGQMLVVWLLDFIACVSGVVFASFGLRAIARSEDDNKLHFYGALALLIYGVCSLIVAAISIGILKDLEQPVPATAGINLAFMGLAAIAALVSLFMDFAMRTNAKFVASLSMYVLYLCCVLISMPSNFATGNFFLIFVAFSLAITLILGLIMCISFYKDRARYFEAKAKVDKPSTPSPTSAPAYEEAKDTNTAYELKKRKDLLDSGVITQEEYEEKRKKYVDML